MPLILGIMQILPQLIQTGFAVAPLLTHVSSTAAPTTPVESFAAGLMAQLPALIASGTDVVSMVVDANTKVRAMLAEKRDPTAQEWLDLGGKIHALQTELHAA